jgi:hypothetical protein
VNHEYAGPFYRHGFKPTAEAVAAGKTPAVYKFVSDGSFKSSRTSPPAR